MQLAASLSPPAPSLPSRPPPSAPADFHYPLSDPFIRWPNLQLPALATPATPPATPSPAPASSESPQVALSKPLSEATHRARVKKLSKLALKRAKDWRRRVELLTTRILSLPPSSLVADVLDHHPDVQLTPDDLAFVVRSVGAVSWRRALEAFEWLALRCSRPPGPRLLASVIGVLARAGECALAEEVFRRYVLESVTDVATVNVYNAMMGAYARKGRAKDARKLLDDMREKGLEPDLITFNTLINARAKAGDVGPGAADEIICELRRARLTPDVITYNTLISACSHMLNLEDAVRVYEMMIGAKCQPDLWTYNAMVSVYGRCGMAQEAERLFDELIERGFSPDAVTYNCLLFAFAKEGDVGKIDSICEKMVKAGFKKDEIAYNTIIHMYGKKGRLDLALELYEDMKFNDCKPDAVTYTVLIDSLGKADRIAEAGKLMTEMVDAGLCPTLRTFSALICGYAKAGMRTEAEETYNQMVRSGIKPDQLAYSVMIDIFSRFGETGKAMVLYRAMTENGFRPEEGLYQIMLAALVDANENSRIQEVIRNMENTSGMDPQVIYTILVNGRCLSQGAEMFKKAIRQGINLDHKSFFSMINIYQEAGMHEEGTSLLEFVKENIPGSDSLVSETLIMLLCKKGQAAPAVEEYGRMRMLGFGTLNKNSNFFECLITCCVDAELYSEASMLFADMRFVGLQPSRKIFESMILAFCKLEFPETAEYLLDHRAQSNLLLTDLSSCLLIIETYGNLKLWRKAEILVKNLRKNDDMIDRRVWNALIHAYAQSGCYEQARAVFNMMIKSGPQPTVDSINGLVEALIVDERLDELYVVVQELQDMGFKISKSTILLMLDAFARAGNIFEVKKIYSGMKAAGYLPNMHLYRSMIILLCSGKRVRDVELMVGEMDEAGLKPDLAIFNALLKMYTSIGTFKKTIEIYHRIMESGLKADEDTYNTLIVMYSREMKPEEGITLLNEMQKQGLKPKVNSLKSLLNASWKGQLQEQCEHLFKSMRMERYKLDRSVYHMMMKMYRSAGDHTKAERLLGIMKEDGIAPTISTMHLLMTSYGAAGQTQEAETVLNNLKVSGLDLSTLPYSSLIDAYLKKGDYNLAIMKMEEMKNEGIQPDHNVWTCFIRAACFCERSDEALFLLKALQENNFDLPLRLLTERTNSLIFELDLLLDELGQLEDSAPLNFVNSLEDLMWAFERRKTASWIFQLATKRNIYRSNAIRVEEKDWGADFRKLSAGAALVGLTLWLDRMQDASLQGFPESPKSVVLITGAAEYNMVSLNKTIKAFLWEMGSPFLPCKTRTGLLVAKAHSLRMWLKDSSFCMDLELKDAPHLPEINSMKLNEGYFMRAGLLPAFKDIHERLGNVWPKKFARLALLSDESRDKVIKAGIQGRNEKIEKIKRHGIIRARKATRKQRARIMRRQHRMPEASE